MTSGLSGNRSATGGSPLPLSIGDSLNPVISRPVRRWYSSML